jgi:Skp family chaperone for outer membrane proteins
VYPNLGIIRAGVLCVLFFAGLPDARPPSGAASGQTQSGKIGTVEMQRAVWATFEGKRESADVEGRFGLHESELATLNIRIEEIRGQLEVGQTLGTAEAQHQRRLEGTHLVAQFNRKKKELTEDLQIAQAEILKSLTVKMEHIVSEYAASHGFMVVFDSSKLNPGIVYKADGTDLTDEMIRLYNQTYP